MKNYFIILILFQTACGFTGKHKSPSVLVIAVDSLKHDDVSCSSFIETRPFYGFFELCRQSFKFNNAITTSVLAAPAMTSILTAKYPFEHGLIHNGSGQFLSAEVETIPELLVKKQIRTSFFSGGAPLFRKLGISQGFEVFNDYVSISYERLFRSAFENVNLFLSWLSQVNSSFFSVIYFPDLQFSNFEQTENEFRSQRLKEIDEALGFLQTNMEKLNRWHNTVVIFVGLNGKPDLDRAKELPPYELSSDTFKVSLFIKPKLKRKDRETNIFVEYNINFIDLGNYILKLFNLPISKDREFYHYVDLKNIFDNKKIFPIKKRKLLIESAWPFWRLQSEARFAILEGEKLILNQHNNSKYNIWADRMQKSSIKNSGLEAYMTLEHALKTFLINNGLGYFKYPETKIIQKYKIAKELWNKESIIDELLAYSQGKPDDQEVKHLVAYFALKLNKWKISLKMSDELKNPYLKHVALKNLGFKNKISGPCWDLLELEFRDALACNDLSFINLVHWIKNYKKMEEEKYKNLFFKYYKKNLTMQKISRLNWYNYNVWDVKNQKYLTPSLVDLALALPKYSKFKDELTRKIKNWEN